MEIDWKKLNELGERLSQPSIGGGNANMEDLHEIDQALKTLIVQGDHTGILELHSLFAPIVARDSIGVHEIFQRLTKQAIHSAEKVGDVKKLAHLLSVNGHNLHRQGLHQQAMIDFSRSRQFYELADEPFEVLKVDSMLAQCYRTLGYNDEAKLILDGIFSKVDQSNPWLGNPLQVLGWIQRDNLHLKSAEKIFRQALALHRQTPEPDILLSGTLADLGEVIGLQGRHDEAVECFEESLLYIRKYEGQYDRQESRTITKLAELFIRKREYSEALRLLDRADDLIAYGAYKDQLWKIDLLRAMVNVRQGRIGSAIQRIRSAKTIYEGLGLPPGGFLVHTFNRLKLGSGLFSFRRK